MFIFYLYVSLIVLSLVAYATVEVKHSLENSRLVEETTHQENDYYTSSFYKNLIKVVKVTSRKELEEITTFFNKIWDNIEIFATLEEVAKRERIEEVKNKSLFYYNSYNFNIAI